MSAAQHLETQCPNPACGHKYRLNPEHVGRTAVCKACSRPFVLAPGVGTLPSGQSTRAQPHDAQSDQNETRPVLKSDRRVLTITFSCFGAAVIGLLTWLFLATGGSTTEDKSAESVMAQAGNPGVTEDSRVVGELRVSADRSGLSIGTEDGVLPELKGNSSELGKGDPTATGRRTAPEAKTDLVNPGPPEVLITILRPGDSLTLADGDPTTHGTTLSLKKDRRVWMFVTCGIYDLSDPIFILASGAEKGGEFAFGRTATLDGGKVVLKGVIIADAPVDTVPRKLRIGKQEFQCRVVAQREFQEHCRMFMAGEASDSADKARDSASKKNNVGLDALLTDADKYDEPARPNGTIAFGEALKLAQYYRSLDKSMEFHMTTFSTRLDRSRLIAVYGTPDEEGTETFVAGVSEWSGAQQWETAEMIRYKWLRIILTADGQIKDLVRRADE